MNQPGGEGGTGGASRSRWERFGTLNSFQSEGGTTVTTLAPNLERVAERIRPEYLRRWLANPKAVLPHTPMTADFLPEGPPLEPELFQGKTIEQLDAVMDLLLNYDWYLRSHTSIRQLVPSGTRTDQGTPRRED